MAQLIGNNRRRAVFAVVAIASLALASCSSETTKLSSRAERVQNSSTDVTFTDCGSSCTGVLDGAKYTIKLPKKWNGTLLLYSHGYRFAAPVAAEPDATIKTNAQVSPTDSDGTGADPLSQQLLADGYALAGSSYKSNGWAVADGVQAGEQLHDEFVKLVGTPNRVYVWGDSLGGLITEILAEQNPSWVDGAAPMCGAVAGPNLNFDAALDVAYAVKVLIDPDLQLTNYASNADANANWTEASAKVQAAAADLDGGGTAKIVAIADLVNAPTKTQTYDGADPVSQVKAITQSLLTALAFGTSGRYEVEQRVGGNPSTNVGVDYSSRITKDEADTITSLGGSVAQIEAALANGTRVSADEQARKAFEALGDTTGAIPQPTVTMHTEYDPLVLVSNETVLQNRALSKGDNADLVQLYVAPPETYSESAGAPYGAGHCVFNDKQREALLTTLNSWVMHSVYPISAGVAGTFGPGLDPTFAPGPFPSK